jgi:DNA excision repair protein ERCC-3
VLFRQFREGQLRVLIVSKVANFAIDLPDASVAIQVSGTFGSRQEEAQRLGRILRPKGDRNLSYFYSLISSETTEQEFARNRQLFLTEQGYRYLIESRRFDEHHRLSEPLVWKQLRLETSS